MTVSYLLECDSYDTWNTLPWRWYSIITASQHRKVWLLLSSSYWQLIISPQSPEMTIIIWGGAAIMCMSMDWEPEEVQGGHANFTERPAWVTIQPTTFLLWVDSATKIAPQKLTRLWWGRLIWSPVWVSRLFQTGYIVYIKHLNRYIY